MKHVKAYTSFVLPTGRVTCERHQRCPCSISSHLASSPGSKTPRLSLVLSGSNARGSSSQHTASVLRPGCIVDRACRWDASVASVLYTMQRLSLLSSDGSTHRWRSLSSHLTLFQPSLERSRGSVDAPDTSLYTIACTLRAASAQHVKHS